MIKQNRSLIIVSFALLMESVDATVLNTAIPIMAKSFNVHPVDLKLALISYLLSLAIFIPISGWIADKFGIKKVFISAVALFTLSSFICGFTKNLDQLIIGRLFQGLGGALTLPVGRLVILRSYKRHELISKMSVIVMVGSFGILLGPLIGGFIVDHYTWPWIFWVNVPIGLLAVIFGVFCLPPMPKIAVPPLDKLGFILFGAGLASLTYALSSFSESSLGTKQVFFTLLISILFLIAYILYSRNKKYPIIKIELLLIRTFQISVIGNLLTRLSFGGLPFLLPLLLQIILGLSPQLSGALIAPIAFGVLMIKPFSIQILRLLGYKKLLLINISLISITLFSFSMISTKTPIYAIGFLTFFYGFFISLQYTGMNSIAYANVDEKNVSAATSIMSTIQQLSLSFGVAVAAILLNVYSKELSSHQVLSLEAFRYTFISLSVLTLLSGMVFFRIHKEDGRELIG